MKRQLAKWTSVLMIAVLLMTMSVAQMEEATQLEGGARIEEGTRIEEGAQIEEPGQVKIEPPVDEVVLGLGDPATNGDGDTGAPVQEKPISEVSEAINAIYAADEAEDSSGISIWPNLNPVLPLKMVNQFVPEGGGVFVHCESSDPKIFRIKDDGSFKTLARGEVKVTVQQESGETWQFRVSVDLPNTIVLTESMITLNKGDSHKLTYEFRPKWFEGEVKWSSSDTSIAKVSKSGKVTAKKAGTVIITVTSTVKNLSASLYVKVIDPNAKSGKGVAIDEDHFPDETFRDYIQFLFDINNDGALSDAEISKAVSLEIHGRKFESLNAIHSLKGLEFLTALKDLKLHRLELSKLDISKNTKLERLELDAIQGIKTVNTSSNKALKEFCASDCDALTSINVAKNTKLT